jgi:hypothetical protein
MIKKSLFTIIFFLATFYVANMLDNNFGAGLLALIVAVGIWGLMDRFNLV